VLADHGTVALGDEPVRSKSGELLTRVTSGGSGYSVGKSIAYAYLPTEQAETGTELSVEVFGNEIPAEVVDMPLWDPKHERVKG
jgi:glycine cleavage system aminomethyltransferase T